MATATAGGVSERQWFIVGRWQEYEGEARANLLRIIAIGAFYSVELVNYHLVGQPAADFTAFHRRVTALAVAWTMVSLAILLCLRRQIFPAALKYVSTACDLVLLTALAATDHGAQSAAPDGPFSPLVTVYFLLIALAGLRFSLGLVWFTALGSMLGYLSLVGLADLQTSRWFDAQHAVPPAVTLTTLVALGLTGVVVGQVVRRVKGMAEEYARRLTAKGERDEPG